MNHKYEQRTICPNGEIRTRTIDANELVDLLLQMHFLKQSGEQLMLESNANDENGWAWNQIKVTRGKTVSYFTRIGKKIVLCENVIISECDCSQCPTRELCEALCAYDNR